MLSAGSGKDTEFGRLRDVVMECQQWIAESELRDMLLHVRQALSPTITFSPGDTEADMLRNVIRSMMDSLYVVERKLLETGINTDDL